MSILKRSGAEFIGTFWLVFSGCGSAVLAAAFPAVGIGLLGVALAFGLTVLTMAYAVGHISCAHLNPAVSIGLWAGGRFPAKDLGPYIVAQVLGGIAAAAVLWVIASGKSGFSSLAGFAANGYGGHSPGVPARGRSGSCGSSSSPPSAARSSRASPPDCSPNRRRSQSGVGAAGNRTGPRGPV